MLYESFYDMVFTRHSAGKIWSFICVGNVPNFDFWSVIFAEILCSTCNTNRLSDFELDFIITFKATEVYFWQY